MCNVTECDSNVTECNASYSLSVSDSVSKSKSFSESESSSTNITYGFGEYGWVVLTGEQYSRLLADLGARELERCIDHIDRLAQATGNRNGWKDWNLMVRRCHAEGWGPRSSDDHDTDNPFFAMDGEVSA